MLHVVPINDIKKYTDGTTCECMPGVITEYTDIVVVHNSFDGREGIELYNETIINEDKNNDT